jgi:hypothetical protein
VQYLVPNDILRRFISSQSEEDGLAKLVVTGPLGKLDLGNQHRLDPVAVLHNCRNDALPPPPWSLLTQSRSARRLLGADASQQGRVTAYATSARSARQFIDARGNVFVKIPNPALGVYFASTARNLRASASSNFSTVLPEKIAPPGSRPYRREAAKNRAIRRVCDSKNPAHRLLRGRVRQ